MAFTAARPPLLMCTPALSRHSFPTPRLGTLILSQHGGHNCMYKLGRDWSKERLGWYLQSHPYTYVRWNNIIRSEVANQIKPTCPITEKGRASQISDHFDGFLHEI